VSRGWPYGSVIGHPIKILFPFHLLQKIAKKAKGWKAIQNCFLSSALSLYSLRTSVHHFSSSFNKWITGGGAKQSRPVHPQVRIRISSRQAAKNARNSLFGEAVDGSSDAAFQHRFAEVQQVPQPHASELEVSQKLLLVGIGDSFDLLQLYDHLALDDDVSPEPLVETDATADNRDRYLAFGSKIAPP